MTCLVSGDALEIRDFSKLSRGVTMLMAYA